MFMFHVHGFRFQSKICRLLKHGRPWSSLVSFVRSAFDHCPFNNVARKAKLKSSLHLSPHRCYCK